MEKNTMKLLLGLDEVQKVNLHMEDDDGNSNKPIKLHSRIIPNPNIATNPSDPNKPDKLSAKC